MCVWERHSSLVLHVLRRVLTAVSHSWYYSALICIRHHTHTPCWSHSISRRHLTSCMRALCLKTFLAFMILTIAACKYIFLSSSTALLVCSSSWRTQITSQRLYHQILGMLRSIGRRSVSADNHILWLDRYSLNLADLRNRSQLMTSMREDVHDEWGRKCFGAAVISSPVWNYFDVSRNNEKFAICRLCSK